MKNNIFMFGIYYYKNHNTIIYLNTYNAILIDSLNLNYIIN